MLKKAGKKFLSVVLATAMVVSSITVYGASVKVPEDRVLTSVKEYSIAPGIKEKHITTVDKDGNNQVQAYMAEVDLKTSSIGMMAGYKNYDKTGKWGMQTVRDQAKAAEKATGKTIVAAINGDYFDMGTGQPWGSLVMGGDIVQTQNGYPYFAIMKDGTADCREAYEPLDDVVEAIGSPFFLVKDGKALEELAADPYAMPRCAVGIKADGSVIIYEADGRQAPKSCGQPIYETAKQMEAMGCVEALYLDGGGSATFASRTEGTDSLEVKNSPSDGTERKVSSSLFIYSDAKANGEFDHATISPLEEVYTPGSTVQFEAKGVDSAGSKADLPKDATFVLKDDSFGTIDGTTGQFVSNGTEGTVEVQLKSGDKVVGSTTIEVRKPDSITFVNDEVNLGFEEETDLGLTVKWNNRQVNYVDGDFIWTTENVTDANKQPSDLSIGTFKDNKFTSSDGNTLYGTIRCKYKDSDIQATINVVVGLQPTVVYDFEDHTMEDGTVIPAADWYSTAADKTEPNAGFKTMNYGRGGNESTEVVDIASGEPVRFGNHSLKLNYDFSQCGAVTEGACVGLENPSGDIPGTPTGIGMYVYAPEGIPNFWLRIQLYDANGTVLNLNFTEEANLDEHKLGGFDWTGWKYVEASLKDYQAPYKFLGNNMIRLMFVNGTGMGKYDKDGNEVQPSDRKGAIYIDNIQFVYGANTDDTDNPSIDTISANGTELNDDAVLDTNNVTFTARASDLQNKYTSGVDFTTANVWLDGVNLTNGGSMHTDESKDEISLNNQKLANGKHTIKFSVRDKFGNEASKTKTFEVKNKDDNTVTINATSQGEANIGDEANIDFTASDASKVNELTATVKLAKGYSDYSVSYAEGFEQAKEPEYNKANNQVTIYAKKKASETSNQIATYADTANEDSNKIATLSVKIPLDVSAGSKFSYSIPSATYKIAAGDGEETYTFVQDTEYTDIGDYYTISFSDLIEGMDITMSVKDSKTGKRVKGVSVYKEDGELLGKTDLRGNITTSKFQEAQAISVYAQDDNGHRSFITKAQTYATAGNEDGTPTFVKVNAVKDSTSMKNITWVSKPGVSEDTPVVLYAKKSDYEKDGDAAFKKVEGKCKLTSLSGYSDVKENRIIYANSAEISNLDADTTYVYKVGDGDLWSKEYEFTTAYKNEDTKFFLVGDTQAEDTTIISKITDMISKEHYDFGVQTGDFVDDPTKYNYWDNILTAFDGDVFKGVDMIHVTGNHELAGDPDSTIAKNMFNIESEHHYSVTYGNVYVAVIGYTASKNQTIEDAKWLVEDAAKSNEKWKVVVSHQPPYGTNETTHDCENVHKYISEACDQAGIDFMFSGHDHAYARTNPLKAGTRDTENGTVYYVCGSTGEKSYPATNVRGYDFAKFGNTDYDGIYFSVDANASEFKVDVYDQDGNLLDTYTKSKGECANGIHDYVYQGDGHLICKKCDGSRKVDGYTGIATNKDNGLPMFFANGNLDKNRWETNDNDNYYVGEDGVAVTGKNTIDGKEYTFDENGKFVRGSFVEEVVKDKKGKDVTITRYYTAGGSYALMWQEIDGNLYYFQNSGKEMGRMLSGGQWIITTRGKNTKRTYTFAKDGKLTVGAFEDELDSDGNVKGTRYYWGDNYVTGEVEIKGKKYKFDENGYMVKEPETTTDTTTEKPTTPATTTQKPTTQKPTTEVTTQKPTTVVTTQKPTTKKPTTVVTTQKLGKASVAKKSAKRVSKKKISLMVKKVNKANGYQVRVYKTKKNANNNKKALVTCTKKVVKANKNAITIKVTSKKFKNKKTLYARVRAFRKVGKNTSYGKWSKPVKIKNK